MQPDCYCIHEEKVLDMEYILKPVCCVSLGFKSVEFHVMKEKTSLHITRQ